MVVKQYSQGVGGNESNTQPQGVGSNEVVPSGCGW